MRFWQQPMLQFFVIALCIFALIHLFEKNNEQGVAHQQQSTDQEQNINISEQTLVQHLKHMNLNGSATKLAAYIADLSRPELNQLVEDYKEQEVLLREARRMRLDGRDPKIRQQMVDSMRAFLTKLAPTEQSTTKAMLAPEKYANELQAFYKKNSNNYQKPEVVSFRHVFFSSVKNGKSQVMAMAQSALSQMQQQGSIKGDRFGYGYVFTDRERPYIDKLFGASFTAELFQLPLEPQKWHGPIVSRQGVHLVQLIAKFKSHIEPFEKVSKRVETDMLNAQKTQKLRQQLTLIMQQYQFQIDQKIKQRLQSSDSH